MGPVSFTTLPFTGSDRITGRLATELTDAGVKVVSIQRGTGLVIRSNDIGRARAVLEEFEKAESGNSPERLSDNSELGR